MIFSAEIWANGGPCDKQEQIPHRIVDTVTIREGMVHLVVVLDEDLRRARRVNPVADLPDGWVPLETITITKALDEDGDVRVHHHATDGLNSWEAIGMCTWTSDTLRKGLGDEDA